MLADTTTSARASANGRAERLERALGELDRLALVAQVLADDDELVATEAGHGVVAAHGSPASRRPTATSSSSPVSWPRPSLTTLKRSRSMNSTATIGAARRAAI